MKSLLFAVWLSAALQIAVFAQVPAASPLPSATPPVVNDDEVVVINTNLIQVDAIVTGKDGKQVTDLKAEDFEILENGVRQKITSFSYVNVAPAVVAEPIAETNQKPVDKLAPPVPIRLKPEQVRRTIALVVDDLGLSFESMNYVRQALKKFVDEQMQPNDLVAIVRTSGGIGALQQFSSDKRQLYAAIERVRFNFRGRGGVGAFAPLEASPSEQIANATGNPDDAERARQDREFQNNADNFRNDIFSVGTLGALQFIVQGMGDLPGRKAVVLLSDGFRIFYRDEDGNIDTNQSQRVLESLRRLTDQANRASVVVNTIDARGLQTLGLTAADDTTGFNSDQLEQRLSDRRAELFDTQDGLNYLAQQTGGRAFRNNNDIKGSVEKVLDDQRGYYLLGYEPDAATFDATKRRFNKLTVKVSPSNLKVRYRSGFFGVADAEAARTTAGKNPQQRLMTALTSPFGANDVGLRINTLFGNDAKTGSYLNSLVHIQAKDLKFTDEPDNMKKAVFDVVAYTFGDNGVPLDQVNKTYTMTVRNDDSFRRLLEKGFVYYIIVPVKKPGGYQLRIALRDTQTEKLGAANQFVEVPNLKKERLTVSGIVLRSLTVQQYEKLANGQPLDTQNPQDNAQEADPQTDTALRRFRGNTVLQYAASIYNAKSSGAAGRPQLIIQTRLFENGKPTFEGKPIAFDTTGQTDLTRISFSSAINLPPKMKPGEYVLQIVVTDQLAKEKRRTAAQFVEFEVIN